MPSHPYLSGPRLEPRPVTPTMSLVDLVEHTFLAYNAARLREACGLYVEKMLREKTTVGLSLTGALTPAGVGISTLIPLIRAGMIDWVVSTGANLYHDAHYGLGLAMHKGSHTISDVTLRDHGVVRIYDIFFDYDVLLSTDTFFRRMIEAPEFQKPMSSAEFHHHAGRYLHEREKTLGRGDQSLLSVCYQCDVPVYTSSPGDSSIGMNIAAKALFGGGLVLDPNLDVNETASIVLDAKRSGGESGVLLIGGGSPKNFVLQTEPQIQEVLGIEEKGHDYFLQMTDARPDTGGLSGATPSEAVSWGKVDPSKLPDAVVCYLDSTVGLPILAAYALAKHPARPLKRLFRERGRMMAQLKGLAEKAGRV